MATEKPEVVIMDEPAGQKEAPSILIFGLDSIPLAPGDTLEITLKLEIKGE